MISANENSFVTPDHDLRINYSSDLLLINSNIKKTKILASIYLTLASFSFVAGLLALFLSPTTEPPLSFSFTTSKILIGFLSLIGSYFICLVLFKLFFRSYRNKRLGFFDKDLLAMNELLAGIIILQPVIKFLTGSFPLEYYTLFFLLFASWNFIGYTTYKLRNVEISVRKENDSLKIEGIHILPLFFPKISFLTVRLKLFSITTPEIFLSIIQRDKQSVQKRMEMRGRIFFQFQTLSLEEARNIAKEKDSFLVSLTDKKFTFGSNSGAFIGSNFSIGLIEEILNFLNTFSPASVIKLENKTDAEFTKFAVEHPLGSSKRTRNILLIFLLVIVTPLYAILIVLSAGVLFLSLTLPEVNQKLLMLILFFGCVLVLILPFFIYKTIRNAQNKERALLDKYDITQK